MFPSKVITNHFEVPHLHYPGVFFQLVEIGEEHPLADFVSDDGPGITRDDIMQVMVCAWSMDAAAIHEFSPFAVGSLLTFGG